MQTYETVMVIKPQLSDTDVGALIDKTKKLIANEGGEILSEDKWGRRKLAYQIEQCREGFYVYLRYHIPPAGLTRLDHQFKIQDTFIRTLTVKHQDRKAKPKKVKVKKT